MQIRYFLSFALSLLILEINSLASELKDSVSFGVDTYSDNADVQVYSPTLAIFKKISHNWMLGFKMRVDAITAASITNGSNAKNVDAVTSASSKDKTFSDIRYAPTLITTYQNGDDMLSFGVYYSQEVDYIGKAFFVNYVRQLNQQNTALGISISQSFDTWNPIYKRNLPKDNRNEGKIDLSINQLISPTFSVQLVYSHMISEGFLSSPYHFVSQIKFSRFENYPERRVGDAFAIKSVYLLSQNNSMNISYRYYLDNWAITSHTINTEFLHDINNKLTTGIRLRYYSQSKASFSKAIGTYTLNDAYFAVDYRMSAFDSYTIGIPFIYKMKNNAKVTLSLDYYQTSQNSYIKDWYGVNSISAVFSTLTYNFSY